MKHPHCLAPSRLRAETGAPIGPELYARLFPDAPTFEADDTFLFALGRSGGLCDCGDGDDDAASLGDEAAGWPFFGQFVAHDITADRSALKVGSGVDPSQLRNARSPRLNLECLYGDGPIGHPFLYQRGDPAKLLTGPDGTDLLRNHEGTAIIGDPRNDSHLFMSQMHLSFVRAHNALVDQLRESGISSDRVFDTAVRELRWHYQTVVLEEFLPRLIGTISRRRFLRETAATIGRPEEPTSRSSSPTPRTATGMDRFGIATASTARMIHCRSFPT